MGDFEGGGKRDRSVNQFELLAKKNNCQKSFFSKNTCYKCGFFVWHLEAERAIRSTAIRWIVFEGCSPAAETQTGRFSDWTHAIDFQIIKLLISTLAKEFRAWYQISEIQTPKISAACDLPVVGRSTDLRQFYGNTVANFFGHKIRSNFLLFALIL